MQLPRDIENAFDQIRADEALKARTKRAVLQAAGLQQASRVRRLQPRLAGALCAVCMLGLVLLGRALYFTPTSTISIDINPSVELDVNRFDRIIGVRSFNEDGAEFAASLDVINESYQEAVRSVLDNEYLNERFGDDALLSFAVVQNDGSQGTEILGFISECAGNRSNVECYCVNAQDVEQAHSLGLSYGRYRYYQQILAYDHTITPEQLNGMSMREIRALLNEAGSDEAGGGAAQRPSGSGQGNRYQYGKNQSA